MAQALAEAEATVVAEDRKLVISRVFAAPRALVWEAVTDPWHVGQWWGPTGFSTTITEMNVHKGGKWKLVMHGPDGTKYPNDMTFTEVVPQERIALDVVGGREGAELLRISKVMTFADEDGGTRFTITILYDSVESREKNVREYGASEGGKQTMARLDAFLNRGSKEPAGQHELKITRVFDAPRELVWKAWSDPEMALQWSGPRQFPAFHVELGKQPGDRWKIGMRGVPPNSETPVEIWQGGVLKELTPPEKLVYTFAWEDRARIGLPADGEAHESTITVLLEEFDSKTRMHFTQAFFTTTGERDGHKGGWSSGFDRLEELLEKEAMVTR